MSKYKPLSDFLASHGADSWTTGFDGLERILGGALPKTAREKAAWWDNDPEAAKPHAKAWLDQGFQAEALDLAAGEVTFRRRRPLDEPAAEPDATAHEAMAAAGAQYEKAKAVDAAKKVGVVAAALGVLGGVGLLALRLVGKRKA